MPINSPIDLMFEQPNGWLHSSLLKMEAATRSIVDLTRKSSSHVSVNEARTIYLRQSWISLTGVEPSETHFSIIVPVHNEEHSLPSFLGALFTSEISAMADVQIVFVVNASSDKSSLIIRERLAYINYPDEISLPSSVCDSKRLNTAYRVCHNKIHILVVETPTAGKANALNIGNEIARQRAHGIAINIDANNWVEPDSIAMMYGQAKRDHLDIPDSSIVIVNAREYCPIRRTQAQVFVKYKTQKAEVSGCMFAWSTHWIHENNGFPQYAIEDYGTGLLALSQEKKIAESDANIWVYAAANSSDENREMVRFIYGAMQLAQQFENNPVAMQILLEDFPYLRPIKKRLEYHFSRKRKTNYLESLFRSMMRWLFSELLILEAQQKLHRNPHGQTWDPIRSTK